MARRRTRRTVKAGTTPGAGARTIIYVHGIGNKPIQSVLKCQWDHALFGFDLGERSRLAYWVNREYYPDPSAETCESGDTVRLEDEPTGRGLNIKRHLEAVTLDDEVAEVTGNPRDQRLLRAIARKMQGAAAPPAPRGARARGAGARVLPFAGLRDWVTRKLTRAFLRDVNDYFFDTVRRERMRASVLERIRAGGGPFVVVGHSQGSMIAYDALQSLGADVEVPLFVTIGSPLGITEVQDQVKRLTGQRTLAVPAGVGRWVNVADRLDPVALDPGLSGDYTPAAHIQDERVENPDRRRNPHSGSGYLKTPPVRDAVHDAVAIGLFQPVADFVVTRDLVRNLENCDPTDRHPVLIELAQDPDEPGAAPPDMETTRRTIVSHVRRLARASEEELGLEELRHFVAAKLHRDEIETLACHPDLRRVHVRRVWRNSVKRALLDVSVHTVQAHPAHAGYRATGREIEWAVLDTGINAAHPHFAKYKNVGAQYDCTVRGPLRAGVAEDQNGHGTHVAGIIAGAHTAADRHGPRTLTGMAPEARLRVYKVLDRRGNGEDAWIIKALDHIAETNVKAGRLVVHGVNLSLGGPFDQSVFGCGHSPLCQELRRLWRQGVVVVLAAGNEGFAVLQTLDGGSVDANMDLSIGDPANLEEAVAVGSIHKQNPHTYGISYFSSRGPTADGRQKPDLVAPGERILSCRHRLKAGARTCEDLYVEMSGTSMAAPHVSGVLAAFLSMRKEFIGDPDATKKILLDNCTDLARDRPQQGAGMPNLARMMLST